MPAAWAVDFTRGFAGGNEWKMGAGVERLGYDNLSTEDLTSMAIHGVSPEFVTELARLGYVVLVPDAFTFGSVVTFM